MIGSGYRPCACRDCMEIAIGDVGSMCHHCTDAGCPGDRECQAAEAYGGEAEEPTAPDSWIHPWHEILRLLVEVDAVIPTARPAVDELIATIPEAARADGHHRYWDTTAGVAVLTTIVLVVDTAFQARPKA